MTHVTSPRGGRRTAAHLKASHRELDEERTREGDLDHHPHDHPSRLLLPVTV
ncbi:hypothetical protein [Streptomyces sp. JW3]|uniref:hypothetical protein n=1 Tax=Streptomyces sp. JW3 TaxID=3456955 RepID=UPI003FA4BAE4